MKIGISTACFLTPCPKRRAMFRSYVASMQAQRHEDWMVVFVHDGPVRYDCFDIMRDALSDPRFHYYETEKNSGYWGHPNRQIGVDMCVEAGCEWLGFSNDDNYYVPDWLGACMRMAAGGDANFVYPNMVHSHYDYKAINTSPSLGEIDMGAFLLHRELAVDVRFDSVDTTSPAADGRYVEAVARHPNFKPKKINGVLFVHN